MLPENFSVLNVSRYELRLKARRAVLLPRYLGSTLRGAFGHALKEAVCVVGHRDCGRCMLAERCVYPYLFETPAPPIDLFRGQKGAPHPFILMPPLSDQGGGPIQRPDPLPRQFKRTECVHSGKPLKLVKSAPITCSDSGWNLSPGDELVFDLLLVGRAIEYMPYVIYAVSEMAKRGLGANRVPFDLRQVAVVDEHRLSQTIYSGGGQRIDVPGHATKTLAELIQPRLEQLRAAGILSLDELRLSFQTPARIRVDGDLQQALTFQLLVRNLLRRVSLLAAAHGSGRLDVDYRALIDRASSVRTRTSGLRWRDWERYSNRQRVKMSMGGFVGGVEYGGDAIQEFMPLIVAGEILHVGTGTGFGLGRYAIEARLVDARGKTPPGSHANKEMRQCSI
jgi:CRISPR-associated endoribonuclease Cas6